MFIELLWHNINFSCRSINKPIFLPLHIDLKLEANGLTDWLSVGLCTELIDRVHNLNCFMVSRHAELFTLIHVVMSSEFLILYVDMDVNFIYDYIKVLWLHISFLFYYSVWFSAKNLVREKCSFFSECRKNILEKFIGQSRYFVVVCH